MTQQIKRSYCFFTDYVELRSGKIVETNKLLKIKRIMLLPMRIKSLQRFKVVRKLILSFGNPFCCPSALFVKSRLNEPIFDVKLKNSLDYKAWLDLAKLKGSSVFWDMPLMSHRIHEASATTSLISDQSRSAEDYAIFKSMWPAPIAKILTKLYNTSQKSNELK